MLFALGLLVGSPALQAQISKIVVVDFERAVVGCSEGKQAQAKFNAKLEEKQKEVEKRQKDLEDIQKRLQTQDKVLSDTVKAGLQRDLERGQTESTRIQEDAQKDLDSLRQELLRPIAERASAALNSLAVEQGYTAVIDVSNQANNVLWFNPNNDITAELIKRLDAATPQSAATAPAPAPPAAQKPQEPAKKP